MDQLDMPYPRNRCTDRALEAYWELEGGCHRYVILKLTDGCVDGTSYDTVDIDKIGERSANYEDFLEDLGANTDDQCRLAVVTFDLHDASFPKLVNKKPQVTYFITYLPKDAQYLIRAEYERANWAVGLELREVDQFLNFVNRDEIDHAFKHKWEECMLSMLSSK